MTSLNIESEEKTKRKDRGEESEESEESEEAEGVGVWLAVGTVAPCDAGRTGVRTTSSMRNRVIKPNANFECV